MANLTSILIQQGLITPEQLQDAKDKQCGAKKPLQELLLEMGFVTEDALMKVVATALRTPVLSSDEPLDHSATKLIPFDVARRHGVFPVNRRDNLLLLAMTNPIDITAIDEIRALTALIVKPVLATKSQITRLLRENYQLDDSIYDLLKNTIAETKVELIKDAKQGGAGLDLEATGENSPVIKLVNLILGDAVKMRATDIHVEPQESHASVRYRIDGSLRTIVKVPMDLHPRLVARIKILAGMNIAETRQSQDGRIKVMVNEHKVDLRISVVPTYYGEKIAIRLLDHIEARVELDKIGLEKEEMATLCAALRKSQGMVLVTGPTGSGKTSTLYAALNFIKSETKHIITIEDPVEYVLDGVNQIQLNPAKDVTFANILRNILRQDPNIIFVGEIRDRETADIAFQAAQTGHLVFSTLHTNNSIASVTRLADIGLERYLIASSLVLVVAQRLVRLICPKCKEEYAPDAAYLERYAAAIEATKVGTFYRGRGCRECNFTGYFGRTAVFEILEVTDSLKTAISSGANEVRLTEQARAGGLRTLADSAIRKVADGQTTFDEIARTIDISKLLSSQPTGGSAGAAMHDLEDTQQHTGAERPVKLLIVDDEEDILRILERRLTTAGYAVVKGRDGIEAVEMAFREKPDLIIMDVNMPNMDGFTATRELRSKLATSSIPIIMLTAKQDKESEIAGLEAGADDYITKPYDKDKLLARVRMLLKRK
jgi:type IV pilus assembly protein PilB